MCSPSTLWFFHLSDVFTLPGLSSFRPNEVVQMYWKEARQLGPWRAGTSPLPGCAPVVACGEVVIPAKTTASSSRENKCAGLDWESSFGDGAAMPPLTANSPCSKCEEIGLCTSRRGAAENQIEFTAGHQLNEAQKSVYNFALEALQLVEIRDTHPSLGAVSHSFSWANPSRKTFKSGA